MRRALRLSAAMLVALALPTGAKAQGFRRTVASTNGTTVTCVTWNKRDFTYRAAAEGSVRTPADTEFTAIDASFATWQAVADTCSDFKFIRGTRISQPAIGRGTESDNVVVFRETNCRDTAPPADPCQSDGSCANKFHCWDHSDGTIGLTTLTYSTRTGIALDADIELNASGFLFTTISSPPCDPGKEMPTCGAYDVQNTVTHEIGHAVGFDHVDEPTSTMAPTAPLGEISKRIIDVGTQEGFCRTYPSGQPPVPCDELAQLRRRIIARNTGTCAQAPGSLWVAPALLLLLRRRARTAP